MFIHLLLKPAFFYSALLQIIIDLMIGSSLTELRELENNLKFQSFSFFQIHNRLILDTNVIDRFHYVVIYIYILSSFIGVRLTKVVYKYSHLGRHFDYYSQN